jgi:hypothetical protein
LRACPAEVRARLDVIFDLLEQGTPQAVLVARLRLLSSTLSSLERGREIAQRASDQHKAAAGDAEAAGRMAKWQGKPLRAASVDVRVLFAPMLSFYQQLLEENREPEYFGATVQPGDSDAVLMRWKLDDGSFRVIYGDLRAETVAMDQPPSTAP